jgi:predicted GNAT family acetyltransferase
MNFTYEKNRIFALNEEGHLIAEITFPEVEIGIVNINHTFVDPSLRGQGIASLLVKETYQEIKKSGKRAIATCPYVVKWFLEHKDYEDILLK